MIEIKQSTATYDLVFYLKDSAGDPVTGATATVTLSKNGGSFASPSGSVTEISGGFYKVAANATDSNTLGLLALKATATGAVPVAMAFPVVANLEADTFARLGAPVGASISADLAGVPAAALDLADGIETSVTVRQAIRALLAVATGKASGGGTTTITFRNPGDSADRVTMTVDADGDRSSVTLNL